MVKKVCETISTLIMILLLAVALTILVPMVMGMKELAVLSGSMEPTIPVGSIVYVKPMEAEQLEPGDVCTFRLSDGSTLVTHRVVSIDHENRTLVTQGDANDVPDGDLPFAQVVGKGVFHLPLLGFITMYAKTPIGILCIGGLLALVLLVNFIPAILNADDKKKEN